MKNKNYNWNLKDLLKGQKLEQLYKKWYDICSLQVKLVNDFYKTKEKFIKWLELDLEEEKISNRLSNYISNNAAEDLANQVWMGWIQKLNYDAQNFSQKLSIYSNLVLKNEKIIRQYLKDPKLSKWTRVFELQFRCKPHILDDKAEALLTKLSIDNGAYGDVFTTLTDSDIKFQPALDSKNKTHPIKTSSDVVKLLKSHDRVLRKNTWINFKSVIYSLRNTLTKTLYYNYLRANTWAKTRNYKDYIDATLFHDEVDKELLLSIYENVQNYKKAYIKFKNHRNKIIKKIFKIQKLEPWDLNLDLISKPVKFTIEQAQTEILNALKPLGNNYQLLIKKAFNDGWISWLPKENKTSGAYSIGGTYGLDKYYILANFENTSDSVSTIAHELGHSLNSYFINQHQDVYASVEIFVAEIASIVNEMLLNFYWLNKYKNNKKMLMHIYENILSTFFNTTSTQIIFSKFEWMANELINSGKPFTSDVAASLYLECRKQYNGVSKENEKKLQKEPYKFASTNILAIPHFYANNFYVYKYAIGQIVAIVVANKIFNNDKKILNKYFEFLSAGCSKSPLEIINILGINLKEPTVYKEAETIILKLINKFIEL